MTNHKIEELTSKTSGQVSLPLYSFHWWGTSIILILSYFTFAFFGLYAAGIHYGVILLWPPSGIAMALCIAYGRNLFPAVFVGSTLVGYSMGFPLPVILGNAASQVLEVVVGTGIFYYITDNKRFLSTLKEINGLVAAAILGPAAGGILGILTFVLFRDLSLNDAVSEYYYWVLRNSLGIVTFSSFILVWRVFPGAQMIRKKFEDILLAILLFALIITGIILFINSSATLGIVIYSILLPYILFVSSRFDLYKLTVVNFFLAFVIIFSGGLVFNVISDFLSPDKIGNILKLEMLLTFELFVTSLYLGGVFSDRRNVIRRLKENKKKYKDLFLSSSEAIFILDGISLERVDVNNTALQLYGYNRAEFLSKFPVRISDESFSILSKLKTGKIGDVLQIKNRTQYKKDGSSFLALITVNFLDISNQKMIQILVKDMADVWSLEPDLHNKIQVEREKVTDILKEKEKLLYEFVVHKNLLEDLNTEVEKRKITEHSLRISEEKYRSLVENSMIGIIIHIDGIVVFHNSAAKDIIGARETDKLIGQRVLDYVHSDYQDTAIKRMSDLHSKETADQGIIEEKFIKFNGDIIDVVVLAKAITFEEKTAVMVTFLDITKQKIIENKIKKQKEDLAFLSNCLIDAQETERKKIAQDLHDELGHSMIGIILNLDNLKSKIDPILTDQMRNILNDTINLVSTTDTQIHEMSLNLRPMMLEELGLVSTLSWYTRQFRERFGIDTKLKIDKIKERISPELDINIFRIVQESLTNIAKYANAQHAQVLLEKLDDNIHLSVIDDGNGFDVHSIRDYQNRKPGMGIMGMEERTNILSGSFEIKSKPGKGCHLLFTFPCSKNKDLQ